MQFAEMDDGVRLRTWVTGQIDVKAPPIVMVHGGPGLPDYLAPVAELIVDLGRIHRYDQRGVGRSKWDGLHTIARHVRDLKLLLGAWGYSRAVLVGHSFGTDLVSFFVLAHPDCVAGVIYLSGPFLGPWREAARAVERSRRSEQQQARLDELTALTSRAEAEEVEFLTLSWFPNHADRERAWGWAHASAHERRPVNYSMNAQLNAAKRADPLELKVEQLRENLPPRTLIICGAGDPRPAASLHTLADRLDCGVITILDAGHEPWLEKPDEFQAALRSAVKATQIPSVF